MVQESPYYALDKATRLLDNKQYAEAIAVLTPTLEKDPVNLFTNFNLGLCYMELANLSIEKAATDGSESRKARTIALLKKSEFFFRRVQNLNPELSVSYFKLGKISLLLNESAQAEAYYKEGIEMNPENAALEFNLARVYDQREAYEQALHHYNRAIALDPNFIYAYNNMGLILESQKKYKEAEKAYKTALQKDPEYNFARLNLGNLYAELDRLAEAKQLYLETLRREPGNSWAHLYLGNVYFVSADFVNASKEYKLATQLNPDFSTAYYLLAISLSKQERLDEAIHASLQYMNLEPEGRYSEQLKHLIVALKLHKSGAFYLEETPATQP